MKKEELFNKLQHRFGLIYSDDYLQAKINELGNDYNALVMAIKEDLKKDWNNQNIDWLVDYINNNIYDGLTAEINFEQIKKLILFLLKRGVRINYNIFVILINYCPILEDIFISILGYKDSYKDEDINNINNRLEYQRVLIYYCCYHNKWQGTLMHDNDIKITSSRVKINLEKEEVLSLNEERKLLQKAKMGDTEARDILIRKNLSLVYVIARKYVGRGVEFNDLVQQGTLGLIKAIDNFDLSRGNKLSTYASYYIKNEIKFFVCRITNPFHISKSLISKYAQFKYEMDIIQKENKTISFNDLCAKLKINANILSAFLKISQITFNSDDTKQMEAHSASYEYDIPLEIELNEIIRNLPEEQRKIIEYIYGFNCDQLNFSETGRALGISRQYVNFVYQLTIKKISLIFYLLGYRLNSFDKYLKEIPTYQELNIKNKVSVINSQVKTKLVNKYSWVAYNLGLISLRTVIYLSVLKDEEIPNYLLNLLYGKNTYVDIQKKYFQKNRILKK